MNNPTRPASAFLRLLGRVPSWLTPVTAPVLRPTHTSVRGFALAVVIANAVIIATGEAVRLSASGLGCPDWPQCTKTSVVAAHSAGQTTLNTWIEFGNRLLNFPLVAIAGLALSPACATGRTGSAAATWSGCRLRCRWAWSQAVVGGILVLSRLNPAIAALHYLLSSAILAAAHPV